ncbi:MAG TPA: hypothetical protein VF926_14485, partial [Mycobacterium sp.]
MTESITAQTPGRLVFDKDGDIDQQTMDDLIAAIRADGITDLVVFSHGWNNDEAAAKSLYERWFGLLAAQVDPDRKIGYVGIRWPAQLWRDEPIPEFDAAPAADHGGAAGLVFDKDGDIDQQTMDDLMAAIRTAAVTDLVVFSHGWNNDEAAAKSLYERWFGLLAAQVGAGRNVGYVGIRWPAQLWRDEPIPDFPAAPAADHGGAAGLNETPVIEAGSSTIDPAQLADLKDMFPNGSKQLDTMADLLAQPAGPETATKLFAAMREFSSAVGVASSDGEADPSKEPGMLDEDRNAADVFTKFADGLAQTGVEF